MNPKNIPGKKSNQVENWQTRKFPKRYYASIRAAWKDLIYLLSRRDQIKIAVSDDRISPAFRERMMMAVTEVNNCRYCRSFHIRQSYRAGISHDEIQLYLSGLIPDSVPEDQKLGLLYAKNWAERERDPDPVLKQSLVDRYGSDISESIEVILRMISMGNLLGNTWDYILYRVSFGKWGN